MKRKLILATLGLLIFSLVNAQSESGFSPEQKFLRTMQLLRTAYVDSVDMERIVEIGIVSMLEHLDPHSVYMTPEEVKRSNEPLQGNFEGIGIQFQIIRDTVNVIATISGGPSEEVGLMAGDKIVAIDGETFVGEQVTNSSVSEKLRGNKGTKVVVGILRSSSSEILSFEIIRDKIPIYSIDASFMINDRVGYIKINRFSNTTIEEFEQAMEDLDSLNVQDLIVDLRNNSGGYLKTAIDLVDQFFDRDKLIVYTEGVNLTGDKYYTTSMGRFKYGRVVMIIDEGSASASEILAGAIQDWDRGVVIGRRSYGKGLVQKPFNYPDGSAVRMTTARYYTPTGRCIQKPYDDDKKKYLTELNERLENGELVCLDSISFPDSLLYTTQAGRKVYGGGGIMPDIFVPLDTTRLSDYYVEIARKNIFNIFIADYLQEHRKVLLEKFANVDNFKAVWMPKADELVNELIEYATAQGIEYTEISADTREFMGYILVAQIARNLFEQEAYYQVVMDIDDEIQAALNIFQSDEYNRILKIK